MKESENFWEEPQYLSTDGGMILKLIKTGCEGMNWS
jgi:hypothetical protein